MNAPSGYPEVQFSPDGLNLLLGDENGRVIFRVGGVICGIALAGHWLRNCISIVSSRIVLMLAVSARHHCYWWGCRDSIVVGERITLELSLASAVVGGVGGIVIVVVGRVALASSVG